MTKARNIADLGSNDVLDTTASGIDVTGTITTDALSQSNTTGAAGVTLNRNFSGDVSSYTNTPDINFTMTDTGTSDQVIASITPQAIGGVGDAFGGNFRINTANTSGTEVKRISVDENGDITMYKDDGSTAGFEFDASTANVTVNGDIQLTETGDTTQSLTFQQVGGASFIKPKSGSNDGELYISGGQTATNRMKITTGGDIIFYKDDGSTAGVTFDASAGSIAIGTTNLPSDVSVVAADGIKVDVGTSDTTRIYAKSTGTGAYSLGTSGGSAIAFHRLSDNSDEIGFETHHAGNNHTERMRLNYHGQLTLEGTGLSFDTTPSKNGLQLYYETDSGIATIGSYSSGGGTVLDFRANSGGLAADANAMRIGSNYVTVNPDANAHDFIVKSDANSNMLFVDGSANYVNFGTNATDIGSSSSGEGVTYRSGESLRVQRASGDPLIVNRVTDDGAIIGIRKNGAGIGSIGSDSGKLTINSSGSNLVLQTGGTSRVNIDSTQMYPQTNGAMNLGHPTVKWGDLLLDSEAKVDGSVNINTSTNKGRINIAGTVSDGVQVFMQHNECMIIGAMSGGASTPPKNATITFESQHLRAMTIEMESSGHLHNNGNDKWHSRHVYSVMSEGGSVRFNQRISGLEFALSTNRMTTTVTKISGSNLWTAQITFAAGYQGAFHFRMMGYGVQAPPTSFVYS
jgi:hypothetical protein